MKTSTLGSILSSREHFFTKNIPYAQAKRSAFTLIEIIFAIVIMGITVVSLPVMMNVNQNAIDTTITQEAIFGASAELNEVLSFRWDENSLDDVNDANGMSKVIETGDCNNTNTSIRFRLRPGHIAQPLHRRCVEATLTSPTLVADFTAEADFDDIDDINTTAKAMFLNDSSTASGYKQDYKSEFSITYADIGTITQAHNDAKLIEITVKNSNDVVITKLRSYTINVGEVDIFKVTY